MMSDAFVVRLLVNALWQVPLCGLVAVALDAALRRWPGHWRVAVWRGALLSAALIPMVAALWNPTPAVTAGFVVLPAVEAGVGAPREAGWFSIGSVYALAVAFFALRLVWQWWRLRDLNAETALAPLTYGVRTPVVVLPSRFAREATDLAREAALAHEAVHVEQRDFAHLMLAEMVALPLAMHPAMAWMKGRLRRAVEIRCDELAAAKFADPREYAQGLIDAAKVLAGVKEAALAPGFWSSKDTLGERMTNLMEVKRRPGMWQRLLAGGAMLTVGFGMVAVSARFATAAAQDDSTVYKIGKDGVSKPRVLYRSEPKYSQSAKDAKVEGMVGLRMEISAAGTPENIVVEKSLEPTLDEAAIDAMKNWQFEPAKKKGKPVRVSATVEINFRLR